MINILPINDIKEHTEDTTCKCRPSAEILENGELMIIHNSFDGREAFEEIAKAEGWLNGCKRLLFSAYLQGKRDQIYWATKWEELTPIGKYRVMKQFLTWYSTVSNKHIHL